jgi:hypothetical protein
MFSKNLVCRARLISIGLAAFPGLERRAGSLGVSDDCRHAEIFGPGKPITPGVVDSPKAQPHPP